MDLTTAFQSRPYVPEMERFISILPTRVRRRIVKRRNPDFRYIYLFDVAQSHENYELQSSKKMNCIFVHVPKSAGISVSQGLFGSRAGGHLPLSYYLWFYGPKRFDASFKFAFVRNPVSRVLSAYQFLKSGGLNEHDAEWAAKYVAPYKTFEEFVYKALSQPEVQRSLHFRPQTEFLRDPRTGRVGVDFMGKVEDMATGFKIVCDRLGKSCDLPHINRQRSEKEEVVSRGGSDLIQRLYKNDFEELEY